MTGAEQFPDCAEDCAMGFGVSPHKPAPTPALVVTAPERLSAEDLAAMRAEHSAQHLYGRTREAKRWLGSFCTLDLENWPCRWVRLLDAYAAQQKEIVKLRDWLNAQANATARLRAQRDTLETERDAIVAALEALRRLANATTEEEQHG